MITKNRLMHRQKGMSTAAIIGVVGIFGLLIITFFKVFPMYYGNFKLKSVLEALQQDQALDVKSRRAIWEALQKRLYIDEVKSIRKEDVSMERKDGKTTITIKYEKRDSYVGNLFIGAVFEESVVIDR